MENRLYEYICKDCNEDFESMNPQTSSANCGSFNIKQN